MQDIQQKNNQTNSEVYSTTPVKLCGCQSLFNFEYNTAFKLHHTNTCKVCDLANETVNNYTHLYTYHDQGKREHGHKTLKYDMRMS